MTDVLSPEQRRKNMAHIRGRDTTPERILRSLLFREGYRFEGWYLLDGNGEERLSDQESCIFTVEGTVRIEARVSKNQ